MFLGYSLGKEEKESLQCNLNGRRKSIIYICGHSYFAICKADLEISTTKTFGLVHVFLTTSVRILMIQIHLNFLGFSTVSFLDVFLVGYDTTCYFYHKIW